MTYHIKWTKGFTDREVKEIDFSRIYADNFAHGTDGHNAKIIIAKMANMLNLIHSILTDPKLADNEKITKLNNVVMSKDLENEL